VRQQFAAGEVGRDKLMEAEMASYHGPGTCTFYGTANTNQMLMEFMGLHLPGASFVNPGTPLREALTSRWPRARAAITALGQRLPPGLRHPRREGLRERHRRADGHGRVDQPADPPVAMARAAGVILDWRISPSSPRSRR
jgi:phosphogluconate dehydratase